MGTRPAAAELLRTSGKRVLVVGLGRFGGGVAVTRWLVEQGAEVTVSDRASPDSLQESVAALADLDVRFRFGEHDPTQLDEADLVVLNPAVDKRRSDLFHAIDSRRVPWTTELNLFCERCPARVIGVTGTFGKSTTCAMLAGAVDAAVQRGRAAYAAVHLGGNIGRSLLERLPDIRASDLVVLEISNAQLEDLPRIDFAPWIAVVTNIEPHHLDRYASYADYVRTKLRIIGPAPRTEWAIVGPLDAEAEALLASIIGTDDQRLRRVPSAASAPELRVPGAHNRRNAACVLAVCRLIGVEDQLVRGALSSFAGLEHRIEFVRSIDGVDYFNDSKSTAPVTTAAAVAAFERPLVVLVGGQSKDVAFEPCAQTVIAGARAVVCFGEAGPGFAACLRARSGSRNMLVVEAASVVDAIRAAQKAAKPGDAVLFSPGAPSFDAYANYAERGKHFAALVHAML